VRLEEEEEEEMSEGMAEREEREREEGEEGEAHRKLDSAGLVVEVEQLGRVLSKTRGQEGVTGKSRGKWRRTRRRGTRGRTSPRRSS